jgi:hypothetical protein
MNCAEADRGTATIEALPMIVDKGHMQLACIFIGIAVRVSNQNTFPLRSIVLEDGYTGMGRGKAVKLT